jgi:hypothetical protein
MTYDVTSTIEDGIERIVYKPHQPKYQTPIVLQHGMWHGVWCWATWQKALDGRGGNRRTEDGQTRPHYRTRAAATHNQQPLPAAPVVAILATKTATDNPPRRSPDERIKLSLFGFRHEIP